MYQARPCGFVTELTVFEEEGLNVGVDVVYGRNLDPERLQNAHVA